MLFCIYNPVEILCKLSVFTSITHKLSSHQFTTSFTPCPLISDINVKSTSFKLFRECIAYRIDFPAVNINNSIYICIGESNLISWCNVPSSHRVCHYTSITLLIHKLDWRQNTCSVYWDGYGRYVYATSSSEQSKLGLSCIGPRYIKDVGIIQT